MSACDEDRKSDGIRDVSVFVCECVSVCKRGCEGLCKSIGFFSRIKIESGKKTSLILSRNFV